ncbi:MAG: hypothetical protein ACO1QB_07630 [Verrucomicrobiales bacterium]
MSSVFNSPDQAVVGKPGLGGQIVNALVGDEAHRFVFASSMLARHKRHLGHKGKANVLSGCVAAGLGAGKRPSGAGQKALYAAVSFYSCC